MTTDEYRQVAELHASCIERGFLTTLGVEFLALLYEAIDTSAGSVLLVEQSECTVVGFAAGAERGLWPVYRSLLQRPLRIAWSLRGLLVSPAKLWRVLEIVRHGQGANAQALPAAELLSIAVAPAWRGRGVSERLYARLVEHFLRAGGSDAFRIVVGDGLESAHRFYRRMGATAVSRTQVHAGASSTVYVQRLSGAQAGCS